jgi:hypothetical protein
MILFVLMSVRMKERPPPFCRKLQEDPPSFVGLWSGEGGPGKGGKVATGNHATSAKWMQWSGTGHGLDVDWP